MPFFSQIRKCTAKLDVKIDENKVITVSDKKHSRMLAVDATRLKQHNRVSG